MIDKCLFIFFNDPDNNNPIFLRFAEHEVGLFSNISLNEGHMMDPRYCNHLKELKNPGIYVYEITKINQELGEEIHIDGNVHLAKINDLQEFNIKDKNELLKLVNDFMEIEWIQIPCKIIEGSIF